MTMDVNHLGPIQPILVVLVWRGGDRFKRALESIWPAEKYFKRIVVSLVSEKDSTDVQIVRSYIEEHATDETSSKVEVICSGRELPTMEHQDYWVAYLANSGVKSDDWIFWLAYDDEIRHRGLEQIVDAQGNWPLSLGTAYFGPWAMRHEDANTLWHGNPDSELEAWTSFPIGLDDRLDLFNWIESQLRQPTYMQMSGSVCPFASHQDLSHGRPRKHGPMRIEMAVAAGPTTKYIQEFSQPVTIIYGRSNSDRANYGAEARQEDRHLLIWLMRYALRHPRSALRCLRFLASVARLQIEIASGIRVRPAEEWRVGGMTRP
jgi:hypothetical protein